MPRTLTPPKSSHISKVPARSKGDSEPPAHPTPPTTHHRPRRVDYHFWVTTLIALLAVLAEFLDSCNGHRR